MTAVEGTHRWAQPPSRAVIRGALSLLLVVAVFVGVLPRISTYDEAWARLRDVSAADAFLLTIAGLVNLLSYSLLQIASLPGLTLRRSLAVIQVSTAVTNTVPAGSAVGVGLTVSMLRSWGRPLDDITRSLVVTGAWNTIVKLGLPPIAAIATVVFSDDRPPLSVAVVSIVALAGLTAAILQLLRGGPRSDRLTALVGRLITRATRYTPPTGWQDTVARFRADASRLLTERGIALATTAVVSHAALFGVLAATMAAVQLPHVGVLEALVAFSVVRVALLLPLTPGGAGLAELGLTGLFVAAGAAQAPAVAVVLVFRALTWLLPIPIGAAIGVGIAARGRRS